MIHSYGQSYEVTDMVEDTDSSKELVEIAKTFAEQDMAEWIARQDGKVLYSKIIVGETFWREYYEEYDEEGNGIGRPIDGRWLTPVGWKVRIEVPD